MKKAAQISHTIIQEYAKNKPKGYPHLVCRIKEGGRSEAFSVQYAGGEICIKADNPIAAAFGTRSLITGVSSGHFAEFLGDWRPRFPLRPLWLGCEVDVSLTSRIGISVPAWMRQEKGDSPHFESFCRRILELGYNSILLGNLDGAFVTSPEDSSFNLEALCVAFREYGLKVILKPNLSFTGELKNSGRCPLNPPYIAAIQEALGDFQGKAPSIDYIFYEGRFQHPDCIQHPLALDATQIELVQAELKMLETSLQGKVGLIYYVPATDETTATHHASWLSALCDFAGNKTILAYSAIAGSPWEDHRSPHPFWETLRQSPDVSATPLMPIVNIGAVRQGEGLWPTLTLDLVERYFSHCHRHHFAGAISLIGQLPKEGALLDCSLWVAAQVMWKEQSVRLLAETWFRAQRPDLDFPVFADALRDIRSISADLSFLRSLHNENHRDLISSEECRTIAASLLARLKHLQFQFEKEEKSRLKRSEKPTYYDYFSCFVRDARRIVLHFLQRFNAPLLHYRDEDDQQEGFWTQVQGLGQGGRYSPKAIFLEHPQKGVPGSRMELIYKENYLF